ncbi:MAG: cytochrome C biogenesis protein, partial [Bacteroidia bacterium]|nr:cytochrome C biogenesis protein [Bacteroidia bacterium]
MLWALNKHTHGAINITFTDSTLTINSPYEGEYMTMATMATNPVVKDSTQPLVIRSQYRIGGQSVVIPNPVIKGKFAVVEKSEMLRGNEEDGVLLKITANGDSQQVGVLGGPGTNNA